MCLEYGLLHWEIYFTANIYDLLDCCVVCGLEQRDIFFTWYLVNGDIASIYINGTANF